MGNTRHANAKRSLIHLGLSGSQGEIRGRARLMYCRRLSLVELGVHTDKHCVQDLRLVKYPKMYAWVITDARVYKPPLRYTHVRGAITWLKL